MRIATIVFVFCFLIALSSDISYGQSSGLKTFNTFTFFYVDNSEGFDSSPLNSALSNEVGQEFSRKLNGVADKPDNYFLLIGCNGETPKQAANAKSLLSSDWLKKYLSRTSKEAEYGSEKQALRESFTTNPVRIKKEVDVYLFLSGYALSQLSKKLEDFPTPLFFPKEMIIYFDNKDVDFNIFLYSNKEAVEKLGESKIKSYFSFCNSELNLTAFDIKVVPL